LFRFDVAAKNRAKFRFPFRAPRPVLVEGIGKWRTRVHASGVDCKAGILRREPPGLRSQPQFQPHDVQQVGGVAAVENREAWVQPEIVRVTSQYAVRYRVEGAGPWEGAIDAKRPVP